MLNSKAIFFQGSTNKQTNKNKNTNLAFLSGSPVQVNSQPCHPHLLTQIENSLQLFLF